MPLKMTDCTGVGAGVDDVHILGDPEVEIIRHRSFGARRYNIFYEADKYRDLVQLLISELDKNEVDAKTRESVANLLNNNPKITKEKQTKILSQLLSYGGNIAGLASLLLTLLK